MVAEIENITRVRNYLMEQVRGLDDEQLNAIPDGAGNNIIWNLGHLVAAQQGTCYLRGGVPMIIEEPLWQKYKPGTRPEGVVDHEEIEKIKGLFFSTIDRLKEDYGNRIFEAYVPWVTRYTVGINNIDEALRFLSFHEGYHSGVISLLKKQLTKSLPVPPVI